VFQRNVKYCFLYEIVMEVGNGCLGGNWGMNLAREYSLG